MSLKSRLAAVGIIAAAAAATFFIAGSNREISEKKEEAVFSGGKETLYLWYTDETLTSYLGSAAVTYNETHDVRIVPVLESGLEYLEKINQVSLENNEPDMYILSNDLLEKAYLAGLASEVEPSGGMTMAGTYIGTGLHAASYKDKIIGYPFYFETSSLLYNASYLRDMAVKELEAEADLAEGEASQQQADQAVESVGLAGAATILSGGTAQTITNGEADKNEEEEADAESGQRFTQEQIDARVKELLPSTIEDIKDFCLLYTSPSPRDA